MVGTFLINWKGRKEVLTPLCGIIFCGFFFSSAGTRKYNFLNNPHRHEKGAVVLITTLRMVYMSYQSLPREVGYFT